MSALLILSVITGILIINAPLIILNKKNSTLKDYQIFIWITVIYFLVIIFMYSTKALEDKRLCDRPNPYRKEYIYKQLPSGQYVKTDSIYVRTKGK